MTYVNTNMMTDGHAMVIFNITTIVRNFMCTYVMAHEKIIATKRGQNSEKFV